MAKIEHIGMIVRRCFVEERLANVEPGVRFIPVGSEATSSQFDVVIVSTELTANEHDWMMQSVKLKKNGKLVYLSSRDGQASVEIERELA